MQTFLSDGVSIAFREIPTEGIDLGEPILLIHGFASNIEINWVSTGWVDTLTAAGYRVIALDNRGHGKSQKLYDPNPYFAHEMADDARRLLDRLAIERLPEDAGIDLFRGNVRPGDRERESGFVAQNMNQPAKSASESRKKKMLATPPPVIR